MHRHQYKGRKLGRKAGPRKALMRNLASQIILHEQIITTLPKAKEVRPILEKLITRAKSDTVTNRRLVAKYLSNNDKSLEKLFEQLGPLYQNRNGGYLRIIKTVNRKGDNAEMAIVQLLETERLTEKEAGKVEKRKAKAEETVAPKKPSSKTVAEKQKTKPVAPPAKGGLSSGAKKVGK